MRKKPLPALRSAVMATLVVAATAACLVGPAGTASPQGIESDQSPSGGSERAVPASITDRLKDGSAIAQAVATVVAIGVGGLFAWRNAQIFRVSRAERNQAVWRSKSVPLERRCSAKMSAYDGCRREPLVAARLVEPMRQGNRWLSAW